MRSQWKKMCVESLEDHTRFIETRRTDEKKRMGCESMWACECSALPSCAASAENLRVSCNKHRQFACAECAGRQVEEHTSRPTRQAQIQIKGDKMPGSALSKLDRNVRLSGTESDSRRSANF